jgi:hypothetical protein
MKSKEEMIDTMAEGIYKGYLIPYKDEANMKFKTWGRFKEEHPNTAQIHIDNAEAALKALCGALPDVTYKTYGVIPPITDDNADQLYNQLKQWGK